MFLEMFPAAAQTAPLRWRRSFPGEAAQAAAVRRFVTLLLDEHVVLDDVLLSVDELVVNALRHTRSGRPGGVFAVEIGRTEGTVTIAVQDQGGSSDPAVTDAGEHAECGRGLRMVSALAVGWGWFGNEHARTVAAVFTDKDAS
ncbi:ATP-binding protein [Actinomadura hibisca]|uniref:ATP-binding protein n=1 Tax=Actinomadura hibisca TaxID=68565 RepID=UPI000A072F1C|nr:ATP-binding protein [Actinomadura hibisca]